MKKAVLSMAGALLVFASVSSAQPLPRRDVPPVLQPWIPWALDGSDESVCPVVNGKAVCFWPGRLSLKLGATGGDFVQETSADRALYAVLPGGAGKWPQAVRLDGRAAPVIAIGGAPALWLAPGAHRVEGRFVWSRLPDSLPVPAATALLDLAVDGATVPFARREEDGLLLLRHGRDAASREEELRLKVFRKVRDGVPAFIETRVVIEASGKAREARLVGAALPGTVPIAVRGELPARLDSDGALRVQVRAGKFTVSTLVRAETNAAEIHPGPHEPPWPADEIWVFESNERLRQVELSGAQGIDPSRTDLPEEWRRLPAFLLEKGAALRIKETRRGEPDAAPDQIDLARTLWLDLDGRAFTALDRFGGVLGKTTRLDAAAPAALGRATVDGQDQLVTANPESGRPGVELRKVQLQLEAESRVPRGGELSAVGWDANVRSLRVLLNLPPGWRLLGARGVDRAPGAWLSRWTLFGFFFVLLVAIGAGKLLGPRWGLLALVTLTLCHGEIGAPRGVWLALLAAAALLHVVPNGRLANVVRVLWAGAALVLVLISIPFFIGQVRVGLFPATEAEPGTAPWISGDQTLTSTLQRAAVQSPPADAPQAQRVEAEGTESHEVALSSKDDKSLLDKFSGRLESKQKGSFGFGYAKKAALEQDPHAVIQTGSGVPAWTWRTESLEWSGPVARDHRLRVFLIPPFVNLLLALARVALVTLLAARLVLRDRPLLSLPVSGAPAAAALHLVAHQVPNPTAPQSQPQVSHQTPPQHEATAPAARGGGGVIPDPELLEELKTKLTRSAPCAAACIATPDLLLKISGGALAISAEVHADARAAWPLPGPASSWVPASVTVDGKRDAALARMEDGFLHLRLEPGVHRVELAGPLPALDSLTLQLPDRPKRVRAEASDWQVDGIREDGATDGSIQLSRKLKSEGGDAGLERAYAPWLEVRRVFEIGVSWRVETIVSRISPPGVPLVVRVPLLPGMLPTGDEEVKDGEVLVTLSREQTEARFTATMVPKDGEKLTLKAASGRPWSEIWVTSCSSVWQCAARGIPPVARLEEGVFVSEYRPWPDETLELVLARPRGVEGQTLTLDGVTLDSHPGIRLLDATLKIDARASRTTPLSVTLPAKAEVQSLTVDGQARPIRPEEGALRVSIEAGRHSVTVAWRQSDGMSMLERAPRVKLGQPAVNARIAIHVPPSRWLLLAGGPSWGPAVLFWGELLVMLLAAFLLGRLKGSPLSTWQWLLLTLGLAQLPVAAGVFVAAWFLVFAWREKRPLEKPVLHDLAQIVLAAMTIAFLAVLYAAVRQGLLLRPDMQVAGAGSTSTELRWFQDRIAGETPSAWVLSAPLWAYKVLMLLWSLWLASSLVRWLTWAWRSFVTGGGWKPLPRKPRPAPPAVPPVIATPPPPPPPPVPEGDAAS